MMNEYLLEIRTSSGERRYSNGNGNGNKLRGGHSHRRAKYIKFYVKERPFKTSFIKSLLKLAFAITSVGFLWGMLFKVDPFLPFLKLIFTGYEGGSYKSLITLDDHLKALSMVTEHKGVELIHDGIIFGYMVISMVVVNELYWNLNHRVEESLLIVPNLGVQLESLIYKRTLSGLIWTICRYLAVLDPELRKNDNGKVVVLNKEFYPMEDIKDIVINEGFVGTNVLFYMGVVVKDQASGDLKVRVVFPLLRPRREILESVYRSSRGYLTSV